MENGKKPRKFEALAFYRPLLEKTDKELEKFMDALMALNTHTTEELHNKQSAQLEILAEQARRRA